MHLFLTVNTTTSIDMSRNSIIQVKHHLKTREKWPTSLTTQFRMLTWRQFKQSKANILSMYNVVLVLLCAFIAGMSYFQLEVSYRTLRDQMSMVRWIKKYIMRSIKFTNRENSLNFVHSRNDCHLYETNINQGRRQWSILMFLGSQNSYRPLQKTVIVLSHIRYLR